MIRKYWQNFRRLHLFFYLLALLMMGFGSIISSSFERYSLIDVDLFREVLENFTAAQDRGEEYEITDEVGSRMYRPLVEEKAEEYRLGGGIFWGYLLFLIFWLWPLYRHYFSKTPQDLARIEKRIIGLPMALFILVWVIAAYRCIDKILLFSSIYGPPDFRIKSVFAVSSLLFGSFVSYLNLELTQLYITRYIAKPFFMEHNHHRIKKGMAISMTMRQAFLIFSLAMVPLAFSAYVLVSFNADLIPLFQLNDKGSWIFEHHRIIVPGMIIVTLASAMLAFQLLSIGLYRRNVQKPINQLVKRMKSVARGDFTCKTSALYSDEIGQLKGHFNLMLDGLQEREKIKDTFGKYVSTEIATKVMKSGKVNLSGEEIEATVLFSDIRNFTPLSENLAPARLIDFLNEYFSHITRPIMAQQGVINKFMGDAVMAIFSPVFGVNDHATAALKAAIGMRAALKEFNRLEKHPSVEFGVGIHTGELVAGNVGSENRLEYTVIGDTVNVASRIESQTKQENAEILISAAVLKEISPEKFPDVSFKDCGPVLMKGKSQPLLLYKVEPA